MIIKKMAKAIGIAKSIIDSTRYSVFKKFSSFSFLNFNIQTSPNTVFAIKPITINSNDI